MEKSKQLVRDFWNEASCGETLLLKGQDIREKFVSQMESRYELEPYILPFADFPNQRGKKVLEVGVGLGADHQRFAENGAILHGCDLTERAVDYTRKRLSLFNLHSNLAVADAENLPYPDGFFDMVYSWGVVHHTPNTPKAVEEIRRVLKKGGQAKIMIYHKRSLVGYMLWLRYAALKGKFFTSLEEIYGKYLESPGTKAYSVKGARELFKDFHSVHIRTVLTHGDLLSSQAGQRHQGLLLSIARKLMPRRLIRAVFPNYGLFMLIEAAK